MYCLESNFKSIHPGWSDAQISLLHCFKVHSSLLTDVNTLKRGGGIVPLSVLHIVYTQARDSEVSVLKCGNRDVVTRTPRAQTATL